MFIIDYYFSLHFSYFFSLSYFYLSQLYIPILSRIHTSTLPTNLTFLPNYTPSTHKKTLSPSYNSFIVFCLFYFQFVTSSSVSYRYQMTIASP